MGSAAMRAGNVGAVAGREQRYRPDINRTKVLWVRFGYRGTLKKSL